MDDISEIRRYYAEPILQQETLSIASLRNSKGSTIEFLLRIGGVVGSVVKKRRKRMAKKKHKKLLKKTRIQRRNKK